MTDAVDMIADDLTTQATTLGGPYNDFKWLRYFNIPVDFVEPSEEEYEQKGLGAEERGRSQRVSLYFHGPCPVSIRWTVGWALLRCRGHPRSPNQLRDGIVLARPVLCPAIAEQNHKGSTFNQLLMHPVFRRSIQSSVCSTRPPCTRLATPGQFA